MRVRVGNGRVKLRKEGVLEERETELQSFEWRFRDWWKNRGGKIWKKKKKMKMEGGAHPTPGPQFQFFIFIEL